ncbi:MAG: hypothetical protein VKL23_01910 [Cyanobacteriota bacterium]|jgi:hypothetical protein|nr:hypothetical protein [Cyanobacteriota bacterium]
MRAARAATRPAVPSRPVALAGPSPLSRQAINPELTGISALAPVAALSQERRELICSGIGLAVKVSLALLAGVSLVRLAAAYQERMERHGELAAVLELEQAKLQRSRDRFDRLFSTDGEQSLVREQNQWIAPNRLRVVWQSEPFPTVAPRP